MPDEEPLRMAQTLLLQNDLETPLGCLRLAGIIQNGRGVETQPEMRVYGRYAIVCILRGSGRYRDVQGIDCRVRSGDAIFVFPEVGHRYLPHPGSVWDEIYLTFDGPVFDLWRQTGLLQPTLPVVTLPDRHWPERLRQLAAESAYLATSRGRLEQISQFLLLLGELVGTGDAGRAEKPALDWVARSQAMMDINLGTEVAWEEIARAVGMSYETFRKRFFQATGVTPVRYRLQRRITAARELLRYSPQMTNRQVAEVLGFADEFHFSKRFSYVTGITPKAFRHQSRINGTDESMQESR